MATPISVTALLAAFEKWGVRYVEVRSWRSHNRNSGRQWGPLNGIMIHHTAQSSDSGGVDVCYDGRSDLPGPLCHAVGTSDGRMHLVGHGRANHAGNGDDDVLAAVIAERSAPAPNELNVDGNARFYGLEIVNAGNNVDVYQEAQYVAALRWAAALADHHGWSAMSVIGHKEWTNQKIDPRGPLERGGYFNMDTFRSQVQALLDHGPTGEDGMALSDADISKIARTAGAFRVTEKMSAGNPTNTTWALDSILGFLGDAVIDIQARLAVLEAGSGGGELPDPDVYAQAVADKVEAKLEAVRVKFETGEGA